MISQALKLQVELALARWNWVPLLLALLSASILLISLVGLPRLRQREAEQRSQLGKLRLLPKVMVPRPVGPFAAFTKILSSQTQQHQFLRVLSRRAAQAGLQVGRIDFHTERGINKEFDRFSITLPVNGTYTVVQGFIFGLMADYPALALEKLELRRAQANQDEIDAQVHVLLFVESK